MEMYNIFVTGNYERLDEKKLRPLAYLSYSSKNRKDNF